jgi:hypothetical protein
MDNCSYHMSDDIVVIFTHERVIIITFDYHTTHIFQMLDMVLFGALKNHATGLGTLDEEQSAAAFMLRSITIVNRLWLKLTYGALLQ